ncbi:MAG: DUF3313 domain-containing protein, partial [Methylovulum sp.]
MKNDVNIVKHNAKTWVPVTALAVGFLMLSACTTTEKVAIDQSSVNCALFGDICGKLVPGGKDQFALRYANPAVQWTSYSKILIEPVTFWGGNTTAVPTSDQQMLVNYFSQQLKARIGEKMQIVDQPGPGVMKLTVAMTDAEAATPGLRSISMIVPQAHMLSNIKYRATGTFPFVGAAQVEAKITDSVSGEVLGAAVDRRIGGGNM